MRKWFIVLETSGLVLNLELQEFSSVQKDAHAETGFCFSLSAKNKNNLDRDV